MTGNISFTHGGRLGVGNASLANGSPNPHYAPRVYSGTRAFFPHGQYAALLIPKWEQTLNKAITAVGLFSAEETAIKAIFINQRQTFQSVKGVFGGPTPYDAVWITKTVICKPTWFYQMSWNYIGIDNPPNNDGSMTNLTYNLVRAPAITISNRKDCRLAISLDNNVEGL